MTAELSYHDTKGYYGLRVNPSYEEMFHSLKKKVWIPQPDRSAKWYATGPYRAFLLDQAKRFNDNQRKDLEYDDTGAHLPAAAEHSHQGSQAGNDDTWNRQGEFNSNLNAEEARRIAEQAMAAEKKMQASQLRRLQLSAYEPTSGHWTVEAHHEDLEYRGIPHAAAGQWQTQPHEFITAGQLQAPEFPTYEQLNLGYQKRYKLGRPAPVDPKNYAQLREHYLLTNER